MSKAASQLGLLLLMVGLCGLLSGCAQSIGGYPPYESRRRHIERYDPYPETDIGPEMEGVRPRDFDVQVSEPQRARWRQPQPPPPLTTFPY